MPRYPVSISFEKKELEILDKLAKQLCQTRSAVLKAALAEYIRRLQYDRLCEAGQAYGRSKGFLSDDDIFRIVS